MDTFDDLKIKPRATIIIIFLHKAYLRIYKVLLITITVEWENKTNELYLLKGLWTQRDCAKWRWPFLFPSLFVAHAQGRSSSMCSECTNAPLAPVSTLHSTSSPTSTTTATPTQIVLTIYMQLLAPNAERFKVLFPAIISCYCTARQCCLIRQNLSCAL